MPNKELKEIEGARLELDLMIREYELDIKYHPKEILSKVWRKRIPKLYIALSCMELVKEILDDKILLNEVKELGFNIEHRYQQIRRRV